MNASDNPTIQREQREEQLRKEREAAYAAKQLEAKSLRDTATEVLRGALPAATITTSDRDDRYFDIRVQWGVYSYCFTFQVESVGRYYSYHFEVVAGGQTYVRGERRHRPRYQVAKDGAFPFSRMIEDARKAIASDAEARRIREEREAYRARCESDQLMLNHAVGADERNRIDTPLFEITVTGRPEQARVEVKLKDGYVHASYITRIVEALKQVKP